jgi:hypothetical protein
VQLFIVFTQPEQLGLQATAIPEMFIYPKGVCERHEWFDINIT